MEKDRVGNCALVLSDNRGLGRVIEVHLRHQGFDPIHLDFGVEHAPPLSPEDLALIVVSTISPDHEAMAALAQASLTDLIGRIPLLVISDRPLPADPEGKIAHLDFPFIIERLEVAIQTLLQRNKPVDVVP